MGSVRLYRSLANLVGINPIEFVVKAGAVPRATSGVFGVISSVAQVINVDWGDGTNTNFNVMVNTYLGFGRKVYSAPFGVGVDKIIRITCQNYEAITTWQFDQMCAVGAAPSNLEQCSNLNQLIFGGVLSADFTGFQMTTFPQAIINIVSMTVVGFSSIFAVGSEFSGKIPISIFNKPIVDLTFREQLSIDWAVNNIDKLYLLNSTLRTLSIGNTVNRAAFNSLPTDPVWGLQNLTQLTSISFQAAASFGAIPAALNGMVALQSLNLQQCDINDWGNLNNLINLTFISLSNNTNLPTSLPSYLSLLTKLKTLTLAFTWQSQSRVDTFVDNFYNFIVANAPMVGNASSSFRSMTVTITGSFSPTGTYQQPSGYVAGSSNGSPASQKEKIWVLVNQYSHIVNYS